MFILDTYLKTIGLEISPSPAPTKDLLTTLVTKHLHTFRYSNEILYAQGLKLIAERTVPSLDIAEIFHKLVIARSLSYCFQTTELLFEALSTLGFEVNRHLSKVCNVKLEHLNYETVDKQTCSHDVLIVQLGEEKYLVDTGFANNSLLQPLALKEEEQQIGYDAYKLHLKDQDWFLSLKTHNGEWLCLYQFAPQPANINAVKEAHTQLFLTEDRIPIRDDFKKIALVTDQNVRKYLLYDKKQERTFFKSFKEGKMHKDKELDSKEAISRKAAKFETNMNCFS